MLNSMLCAEFLNIYQRYFKENKQLLSNVRFVLANMVPVIPIADLLIFTCTDTDGSDRGLPHSFLILSLVCDL
jgi:hypothetical protein